LLKTFTDPLAGQSWFTSHRINPSLATDATLPSQKLTYLWRRITGCIQIPERHEK